MAKIKYDKNTKTCVICGKQFIPATYHVYKLKNNQTGSMDWCCSYSCMSKLRDSKNKKIKDYHIREL